MHGGGMHPDALVAERECYEAVQSAQCSSGCLNLNAGTCSDRLVHSDTSRPVAFCARPSSYVACQLLWFSLLCTVNGHSIFFACLDWLGLPGQALHTTLRVHDIQKHFTSHYSYLHG